MTRKYAVRYEKAAIKALKKMDKYQVGLIPCMDRKEFTKCR